MDRVLQVIGGLNRAGAETMLINYYRQLDKRAIQFDFLIYKREAQDFEPEIVAAGGRVLRISAGGIFAPLQYVLKIFHVILKYGPYKAIHIHTLHNGAWALLAALPFRKTVRVMHSHSTANPKRGIIGRLYNTITKFLIRHLADRYVACGEDSGEYLFGRRFRKEGTVIRNGIDPDVFNSPRLEARSLFCSKNAIDPNTLLIVCVGRLMPVKNHTFAIKIAEELNRRGEKFSLVIAGTGELKEQLQRQIADARLEQRVCLLGNCADIPNLLLAMDVYLMPSLFEGLPLALIEAQAAGLPCLISDRITREADMGLELVSYADLNAGASHWVDRLLQIRARRIRNFPQIKEKIQKRGYDVCCNLKLLLSLYEDGKR